MCCSSRTDADRALFGLLAAAASFALACASLDPSDAQRCVTHDDCNSGRTCVEQLCRPIAALAAKDSGRAPPQPASVDPDASGRRGGEDDPNVGDARPPRVPHDPGSGPAITSTQVGMDAMVSPVGMDAGKDADMDSSPQQPPDTGMPDTGMPDTSMPDTGMPDTSMPDTSMPDTSIDGATDGGDGGGYEDDEDSGGTPGPVFPDGRSDPCARDIALWEHVALWLHAGEGVLADKHGRVDQWLDRSHYRHTAIAVGSAEAWPLRVESDMPGRPGIRFGALTSGPSAGQVRRMRIADHPILRFGFGDFSIIAVTRYRNEPSAAARPNEIGALFIKQCAKCVGWLGPCLWANDNWGPMLNGSPDRSAPVFQLAFREDSVARSALTGFNDNNVHLIVGSRLGEKISVEVDRRARTERHMLVVDVSEHESDVSIGANQEGPLQALDGEIFELIVVTGDTARNLTGLLSCLMNKYEIP
jgi:hypothetical protein